MGGLLSFNLLSWTWWWFGTFFKHHIIQNSPARAVICPHAGYRYSGPTAAYSFRQIDPRSGLIILIYFELYCLQGCEDHLCPWSFPPCPTFWMCCHPARRLPNSPLWSQVERFQYQGCSSFFLLQHQYRNQSRAPQHRPLWNNDSRSWRGWAQHWNATPLHSKGGRREPQLVFLSMSHIGDGVCKRKVQHCPCDGEWL